MATPSLHLKFPSHPFFCLPHLLFTQIKHLTNTLSLTKLCLGSSEPFSQLGRKLGLLCLSLPSSVSAKTLSWFRILHPDILSVPSLTSAKILLSQLSKKPHYPWYQELLVVLHLLTPSLCLMSMNSYVSLLYLELSAISLPCYNVSIVIALNKDLLSF